MRGDGCSVMFSQLSMIVMIAGEQERLPMFLTPTRPTCWGRRGGANLSSFRSGGCKVSGLLILHHNSSK